ncbi:uncharacterized protein LOC134195597 isoform X2 [Corticium candelabrum]|uniref:uncharacterized protein LOC134195597 isoform X2 n=1 Tax=Corticium candelabrum TaxID=121492 RepID=UPI002E26E8CE|nr:uncharacterized protein LOC134195597 isoform X2 [Corticium candelabrum]
MEARKTVTENKLKAKTAECEELRGEYCRESYCNLPTQQGEEWHPEFVTDRRVTSDVRAQYASSYHESDHRGISSTYNPTEDTIEYPQLVYQPVA